MDKILLNSGLMGSSGKKKQSEIIVNSGMFIFNGYNLHNGISKRVINSNHDDLGNVEFNTFNYPRTDGGNVLGKYYRTKTITLTMSLTAPTEEGLNNLIDELKFQTSKTQGYLDIIINGIVRRREATLTSLKFGRQSFNVNRVGNVALTFQCINPLAFSLESNTDTFSGTDGNFITEIFYNGKVVEFPSIYFIINSASNLNKLSINMNGYLFSIEENIATGDLILIEGETKLAKINGELKVYDGPFPVFEPGLNHVEISLNNGATANYDLIFIYKNLFL